MKHASSLEQLGHDSWKRDPEVQYFQNIDIKADMSTADIWKTEKY